MKPIKDWATYMAREIDAHDSGGLEILPVIEQFVKRVRHEALEESATVAEAENAVYHANSDIAEAIRTLKEMP